MKSVEILAVLLFSVLGLQGCARVGFPAPRTNATESVADGSGSVESDEPARPSTDVQPDAVDGRRSWSELTRLARENRRSGDYEGARERLAQAALQLADRPATDTARRTVFGLRARLARQLLSLDRVTEAELIADRLFEEAELTPELGGTSLSDLAYAIANRRTAAEASEAQPLSQLPLYRLALLAAETGPASNTRLGLAFEVSKIASRENDDALARRAIELARHDAQVVAPFDRDQLASLEIFKARIALAQGDFAVAEASAASARETFEAIDADRANLAVAEATLARSLAEQGLFERARPLAEAARERLATKPPLADFVRRAVLAELGRLERAEGNLVDARRILAEAVALPEIDFDQDRDLLVELRGELRDLERNADPRGTATIVE